jgi:hypothetical protein
MGTTTQYSGDQSVSTDDRMVESLSEEEAPSPSEMVKSGLDRYSSGYLSTVLEDG